MNAVRMPTPSIHYIDLRIDVGDLLAQLEAHPEAWDQHTMRTQAYETPHKGVSDIWVRFNAWENFKDNIASFNAPHESVWYPVIEDLPEVRVICGRLLAYLGGGKLGGILITRIPPGGQITPHTDHGWHAENHDKYAVQVKGNKQQAFCFEDAELRPEPGDVYTFDNSRPHWVVNSSDDERITLIICIRRTA